jgi:hypothetical protein
MFGSDLLDSDPNYSKLMENLEIRLREVFYWDKTTSSIYMTGSWPIEFPSIQSSKTQHINSFGLIPLSQPHLLFIEFPCEI